MLASARAVEEIRDGVPLRIIPPERHIPKRIDDGSTT